MATALDEELPAMRLGTAYEHDGLWLGRELRATLLSGLEQPGLCWSSTTTGRAWCCSSRGVSVYRLSERA